MESLYRKYRPQTFADVVGQQHVVGTLQRAVTEGRTSHAYLFCGPRGTGKTTMARLLAKSLMCEQGPGHLPDGTCEQCSLIAAGVHPDVYELDAASRTGVDNVREEIINRVGYAPVRGRYKVYIIDEVHMLTTAAFNALLKTLEEPPDHVVFVLCTTDPQKIPATILSRVQRFDFRPIGSEDIRARLAYVCQQEGFSYEDAALDLIVRHARGGMRDALSTLEQLSVFGAGTISADAAQDLLGAVPGAEMGHVVEALAARDVPMLFLQVGELIESGRDPLQFTRDLAAHMRDVYVVAIVGPRPEVLDTSADAGRLRAEAEAFGSTDRIARVLTVLGEVAREMATAPNQRLVLEIAFTRLARPQEDLTLESLAERVAELERRPLTQPQVQSTSVMGEGSPAAAAQPVVSSEVISQAVPQPVPQAMPQAVPQPQAAPEAQPWVASAPTPQPVYQSQPMSQPQAAVPQPEPPRVSQPQSMPIADAGELQRRWRQVVGELLSRLPSRGSLLSSASALSDDGTTLVVGLPKGSSFALKMLERPDVRAAVEGVVAEQFGPRTLAYREGLAQASAAPQQPDASRRPPAPTPAPQPAPQPASWQQPAQPAVPQQPPVPQPPAQPVNSQPVNPQPDSGYPMPWDEPSGPTSFEDPGPEYVPYDDVPGPAYEEPAPAYEPEPTYVPAPQPAPEPVRQPAPSPVPTPQSAPEPPAPEPPMSSQQEVPEDLPPELASILANAFEVFGDDVRVIKG